MKTFFSTAFLMVSGVVLFAACIIVIAAVFLAGAVKKGRLGDLRIDISRDDAVCSAEEKDLNPAARAMLHEARGCVARADSSMRDVERAAGKFAARAVRELREAEQGLKKARARISAAAAKNVSGADAGAAVKKAAEAVDRREKMLSDLRALLSAVEDSLGKLDLEQSSMRIESLRETGESPGGTAGDGRGAGGTPAEPGSGGGKKPGEDPGADGRKSGLEQACGQDWEEF